MHGEENFPLRSTIKTKNPAYGRVFCFKLLITAIIELERYC
jgi:hypothetical protein